MLLSQDHTSLGGILALTVCVTAAAGYQQAPIHRVYIATPYSYTPLYSTQPMQHPLQAPLRGAAKAGAEEVGGTVGTLTLT